MRAEFRDNLTNAIRYWELKRVIQPRAGCHCYRAVLFAMAGLEGVLQFDPILGLTILALLANIAYCAAYIVDMVAQFSGHKEIWRQYRWVLFLIGIVFAAMLTYLFSRDLSAWGYQDPRL